MVEFSIVKDRVNIVPSVSPEATVSDLAYFNLGDEDFKRYLDEYGLKVVDNKIVGSDNTVYGFIA
jgi:hypothetical protein